MQTNQVYLKDLTTDEKNWISELELQRDQVNIFENRLGEVLKNNTAMEVRALSEQFQNRFIRQKEVLDILSHDIGLERQKLENFAQDHPIALDHVHFQDHKSLRERIFTNAHVFKSMREEFYAFIEKWI